MKPDRTFCRTCRSVRIGWKRLCRDSVRTRKPESCFRSTASPTINLILEVGQVTEQVEVQANAALVETRSVGRRPGCGECPYSRTAAERPAGDRVDRAVGSGGAGAAG